MYPSTLPMQSSRPPFCRGPSFGANASTTIQLYSNLVNPQLLVTTPPPCRLTCPLLCADAYMLPKQQHGSPAPRIHLKLDMACCQAGNPGSLAHPMTSPCPSIAASKDPSPEKCHSASAHAKVKASASAVRLLRCCMSPAAPLHVLRARLQAVLVVPRAAAAVLLLLSMEVFCPIGKEK